LAAVLILPLVLITFACEKRQRPDRAARARVSDEVESAAPYQAEVEEGLGAAIAILIDTSGSMKEDAPGDSRPKYVVAREALETMLDATDAFVVKRPDFPIKIGIYGFSSACRRNCRSSLTPRRRPLRAGAAAPSWRRHGSGGPCGARADLRAGVFASTAGRD
jgi:hypothetical protein